MGAMSERRLEVQRTFTFVFHRNSTWSARRKAAMPFKQQAQPVLETTRRSAWDSCTTTAKINRTRTVCSSRDWPPSKNLSTAWAAICASSTGSLNYSGLECLVTTTTTWSLLERLRLSLVLAQSDFRAGLLAPTIGSIPG